MDNPPVNRNVFAVIFAISILLLVFSFAFLVTNAVSRFGETPYGFLLDGYTVLGFLVQVIVLGILIYAGLYLGRSIGLGAPLLESWTKGEPVRDRAVQVLKIALVVGVGVAAAKYLLDLLVFSPFVPGLLVQWRQVPLLYQLHVPFRQGIGDEIVSRLFWMTVLVWILWKARGSGDTPPGDLTYWAGIILAGLIPVPGLVLSGTAGIVILQYSVIVLAGAIPFGWLYWKRGIEAALIAHFVSSVVLVLVSLW